MGVFLGPLGGLREVGEVQAGVQVSSSRPSSERVTLDGRRIIQRAPRASRSWALSLGSWRDPSVAAYMSSCASGVFAGPLYLLTAHAAATNMLPANIAAPGAMGSHGLLTSAGIFPAVGTVPVHVAGQGVVPSVGAVQSASAGAWSKTIPVRQVPLVLSVWASAAGAALEWRTVNAAGGVAQSGGTVSAAAVAGGFRGEVAFTPSATAVGVQVRVAAGSRVVGGLRLAEGVPRGSGPVVATNLVTNAAGRNTSGTVEVRRNFSANPRPVSTTSGWAYSPGTGEAGSNAAASVAGPDGLVGVFRRTVTAVKSGGSTGFTHAVVTSGVAGEAWSAAMWIRSPGDSSGNPLVVTPRLSFRSGTTTVSDTDAAPVTIPVNVWTRVDFAGVSTGSFDNIRLWPYMMSSVVPAIGTHDASQAVVEKASRAGAYFDDAYSPDPDLTPSLSGGASVLRGPAPSGWFAVDGVVYYSATRDRLALRIVSDGGACYAYTSIGSQQNKALTVAAAALVAAPIRLAAYKTGGGVFEDVSNVGTVRSVTTDTTTNPNVVFAVDPAQAPSRTGETVYFHMTAAEGTYSGPVFDGTRNPDPERYTAAWTGTPDASTSVLRLTPDDAVSEGWLPGEGVPMVVVRDPSQTMQLALPGNHRSDYAVTIEEVG